jgi:TonB family protein
MKRVRERASNLLLYGFAASIAAHVLLLPLAGQRAQTTVASEPPFVLSDDSPAKARPTPAPAPARTARPVFRPRAAAHVSRPARSARLLALRPTGARGPATVPDRGQVGVPGVAIAGADDPPAGPVANGTNTAEPAATSTPLACGRPDVVAATLRALEPELPALAQQQGVSGTVDVVVTLDASSRIVAARIAHSPSVLLDAAALAAARGSVFRTETRGCIPIPAEYLFRVDFVGA